MLVAADWLVNPGDHPVREGAVFMRGNRIDAVGRLEDLQGSHPSEPLERFDGCVIIPGLVNAHTRLSLTVLEGLVEEVPDIIRYQRRVTSAIHAMSNDDFAASATHGALECLRCGITTVGDIGYGPEPLAACADAGVGGMFYWEIRGIDEHALAGELAEMEFPSEGKCSTGRLRCGISPQAVFVSGPELIKAEWQVAHTHHTGFAIHVAESAAERDLLLHGDGPLADVARTFAHGFKPPRTGTVAYLERLGALAGAVAVGCVHLDPGDAARLRRHARGVVLCPRASARLGKGVPPVADLYAAGVRLSLGTGSAAAGGTDLFAEARALRELDASLTSRRVLAMMTRDGAETLGLEDSCGVLAPGMQSDLTLIHTGPTEDPETAVLRCGSAETVRAVMGGGVWRVRDGKIALPTATAERAADRAREVARRALGA